MNLAIERHAEGVCHLTLSGRISQSVVNNQENQLRQLLGEVHFNQKILLSLQKTEYIDSSGIGWLLSTDKKIREAGGRFVIHSVPLDVQHVFGLLKLNRVLSIAKDKQQALTIADKEKHDGGRANAPSP